VVNTLHIFRNGDVAFIDFHEKGFKLKFIWLRNAKGLGSCFHADSDSVQI
jgi:hypothetical protein